MMKIFINIYQSTSLSHLLTRAMVIVAITLSINMYVLTQSIAENRVIAKVGQEKIYEHQLNTLREMFASDLAGLQETQRQTFLYNFIVEQTLFAKAAKDKNIHTSHDYKKIQKLYEMRALRDMYYKLHVLPNVTDKQLKDFYDQKASEVKSDSEIRASHILVKTEAEANKIIALLKNGADFGEAAQKYSEGPSKTNGGDLGYFGKGRMVPEFEKAVFALKINQISSPVKTQFGWHIIKLVDKRSKEIPTFESVKENIRDVLLKTETKKTVNRLKKKYIIEDLR